MEPMEFIVQNFDIKKLRKTCNIKSCRKTPTKELLLLEFDRKRPARRIASLYLCEKHCTKESKSLSEKLNQEGNHIGGRIFPINQVTH